MENLYETESRIMGILDIFTGGSIKAVGNPVPIHTGCGRFAFKLSLGENGGEVGSGNAMWTRGTRRR